MATTLQVKTDSSRMAHDRRGPMLEKLQKLPGIKDTFTMTAYKAFSEDKSI